MKFSKHLSAIATILLFTITLASCSSDDDNDTTPEPPEGIIGSCYVQLFDGDHFTDDYIIIDQPGEYNDLSDLPNSDGKDWSDEADSFKVGESTTVTVWTQTDFQGDSTVYDAGGYPSVEEPLSLKIVCLNDGDD